MTDLNSKKYKDTFFIKKYVALWAYGYKNNIGQAEGLYRAVNELGFSYFDKKAILKILDVGCGVGRTASDYAKFFLNSSVVGVDKSKLMIEMAVKINRNEKNISFDMRKIGFGIMNIKTENVINVEFRRSSFVNYCRENSVEKFDIITSVNYIDRIKDIEIEANNMFSILKPGGILILASPLNFFSNDKWYKYNSFDKIIKLFKDIGFLVDIKFDNLIYREVLDARGAYEEYPTLILRLKKPI